MAKSDYFDEQQRKKFLISIKVEHPGNLKEVFMVAIKSNLSSQDKESIKYCHILILNRIKKQDFILNEKDSFIALLINDLQALWENK